jgi:hypothetical protein
MEVTMRHEAGADVLSRPDSALEDAVAHLKAVREGGTGEAVSDEILGRLLTEAIRLYAVKVEASGKFPVPVTKEATATDVVLMACELIRAEDVNMFDLMMWYDRRRSQ